jgi:hypothetical protein
MYKAAAEVFDEAVEVIERATSADCDREMQV